MPNQNAPVRGRGLPLAALALLPVMVALALFGASDEVRAQAGPRQAALLLIQGNDTLAVNRIQRTDANVTSVIAARGAPRIVVTSTFGADHLVTLATFSAWGPGAPDDAPALQTGTVRFERDTVHIEIRGAGGEQTQRIATRAGALLLINNDFVVVEQAVRRARARGVTRLVQPVFALTGGQTLDATLELFARDSARFSIAGNVTEVSLDAAGNVTGGHLPAQNVRMVVVQGAAAAAVSLGRPSYAAPADAPYGAEDVTVNVPAGHVLTGTLTLPKSARGRLPAIVTITGSGHQDRDESIPNVSGFRIFRQVADTLGRRGMAVLRLDDRGVGGSTGDVNGTSADFADDIRAGIAYLRSRPEIDPDRIALVGHSEGGMIAPMIAATDNRLSAIVLMAGPSQTGRRIIDYQIEYGVRSDTTIPRARVDSALAAARAQFDSLAARSPWVRYFLDHDPLPVLRQVKQPVLILHGATDRQVTVEQATEMEATLRAAGNTRVTTRIFADRNHLFLHDPDGSPAGYSRLRSGRVDGEVMGALADWLVNVLAVK